MYKDSEKTTVYTKIWKKSHRNSKAPKIMSSRNQLCADRNQLIQMQNQNQLSLDSASVYNDKGYDWRQDEACRTPQKGEKESKLS